MPKEEKNKRDVHIYMDDATGDMYIFNGSELINIGNSTPQIGDRGDEETQRNEEEKRRAQIQKEREEEREEAEDNNEEPEPSNKSFEGSPEDSDDEEGSGPQNNIDTDSDNFDDTSSPDESGEQGNSPTNNTQKQTGSDSENKGTTTSDEPGSDESDEISDDDFEDDDDSEEFPDLKEPQGSGSQTSSSYEDEETEEERQQRLDDIKNMFGDEDIKNAIEQEASTQIDKELKKKKAASEKELRKYSSSIQRFKNSLRNFVAKQVQRERYKSWQKENPSFEGSGIMMPARMTTETKKIPKINVYFDQSGSWGDSDIKKGEEAIGILNNYVKRGEIVINVYYFANHIHDNPEDARDEGGTHAGAELIEHIKATKPDNVIVMTDADFDSSWTGEIANADYVKVPGAVWLLFRNGARSYLLQQHLQGKSQTLAFDI